MASKTQILVLITRYSDNHCLVTRYPDARYNYAKQSQFAGLCPEIRSIKP